MNTIEADAVRKSFGKVTALAGVDLSVREGTVLGLLGPNGAGKTTLVKILATLLTPDSGHVRIGGRDAAAQPAAVRRLIGLAGQYAAVDDALTGRENLEMIGRLYRLRASQARRRTAEVLERLSLTEAASRPVRTYSGGMRRRLDLGASLVGDPLVLLLDEPSTGLDPASRLELWDLVTGLTGRGTTVLLTTQQLDEADHLADDIAVIDHGTVIARGAPAVLKARLGDQAITVTLADRADAGRAVSVLTPLGTRPAEAGQSTATVTVRVPPGSGALASVVRLLDEARIDLADVTIQAPSLEDVFLSITRTRPATEANSR